MNRSTPLPTSAECPNDDQLKAFVLAILPHAKMNVIEDHVQQCDGCLSALEACDEESDSLIRALSALPSREDDEPAFRTLQAALLSEPHPLNSAEFSTLLFAGPGTDGADQVPHRIGGYELQELIGRGATGAVYRARHIKLDRVVAIKVLNARYVGHDPQAVDRFQSEMKAVGQLDHPHIIRATDAGEERGRHFLVMEYVHGIDASRLLRLAGPLNVSDACEVTRQAALALQFAHDHNMVHRDVKPSNLLFAFDGHIKLLDLGLVRNDDQPVEIGRTGVETVPHGTADYMPPEQWTNFSSVDARADIYSLGCTLYKLLTGTAVYPRGRHDYGAKMDAHHSAPIPKVRDHRPEIPLGLQKMIGRMLAKRPSDRFDSAGDVARRLDVYAQGSRLQELGSRIASTPQAEINDALSAPTDSISIGGDSPLRRSRRWMLGAAVAAIPLVAMMWLLRRNRRPKLETTAWRPLRPVREPIVFPTSLSHPLNSETTVNKMGENGPIQFHAQDDTLCVLGQPVQEPFAINARFTCVGTPQRIGVFFKYRPQKVDDSVHHSFQTMELLIGDEDDPCLLAWSHYEFHQRPDSTYSRVCTPWADASIQFERAPMESELQIQLGRTGFPEVIWNGMTLRQADWTLTWQARHVSRITREERRRAYLGQLGIFGRAATATFSKIELRYLDNEEMT